ncbi:MAG: hypothetical protein DMG49_05775 [Acidobacteria bacterium]|nr:MAG: hypothetical protein DMG49_05775 [Acidobacteriota bacterium]
MFQLLRTGFSESGVLELTHPEKTPAQVVGGLDLRATELQANAATTAIMRTVVTSAIAPAHNICTELPKVSVRWKGKGKPQTMPQSLHPRGAKWYSLARIKRNPSTTVLAAHLRIKLIASCL